MTEKAKRPDVRAARVAAWVLAVGLGLLAYYGITRALPRSGDPVALLGGSTPSFDHTVAVEHGWVEEAFPPGQTWLTTPPGPLPCAAAAGVLSSSLSYDLQRALSFARQERTGEALALLRSGTRHWLPSLAQGQLLIRDNEIAQAQRVMIASLAAHPRGNRDSSDKLRALIYLQQAVGYLQIEHERVDDRLWTYVKNPIGTAKLLSRMGLLGEVENMPTWSQLEIPPPGCGRGGGGLTTYDLYNNLVVAYLKSPDYHDTARNRTEEFRRDYRDSPASNPLLAVLRATEDTLVPAREHWVWAISNAERILRWSARTPDDSRLAYNLAALLDSALPHAPEEARAALLARRDELRRAAARGRERLAGSQRQRLALGLTRLELLDAARSGRPPQPELAAEAELAAEQTAVVQAVTAAVPLRMDGASLNAALDEDEGAERVRDRLGDRAGTWRPALRRDVAGAIVRRAREQAAELSTGQKLTAAQTARELLAGAEPPPELAELEASIDSTRRHLLSPALRWLWIAFAVATGVAVFYLALREGLWLVVQLRRRKELFSSFYRLEAQAQREQRRR